MMDSDERGRRLDGVMGPELARKVNLSLQEGEADPLRELREGRREKPCAGADARKKKRPKPKPKPKPKGYGRMIEPAVLQGKVIQFNGIDIRYRER